MIYLDNAATTIKKPDAVYDAVLDAMKHCGNSGRGASDASLDASRKIYEARMCLTEFFGGDDAARLVFTANATEALNIAIHGLFEPGEHVITTQLVCVTLTIFKTGLSGLWVPYFSKILACILLK